jgi:hypothetical protein
MITKKNQPTFFEYCFSFFFLSFFFFFYLFSLCCAIIALSGNLVFLNLVQDSLNYPGLSNRIVGLLLKICFILLPPWLLKIHTWSAKPGNNRLGVF